MSVAQCSNVYQLPKCLLQLGFTCNCVLHVLIVIIRQQNSSAEFTCRSLNTNDANLLCH